MKKPKPFVYYLEMNGDDNCWNFIGTPSQDYPSFSFHGELWKAHRFSYTLFVGKIPDGLCVLHKCDNPKCCNPKHLFLGTILDNNRDMISKGRANHSNPARGEKHGSRTHPESRPRGDASWPRLHPESIPRGEENGMAKLLDTDIPKIFKLLDDGYSQVEIAKIFGVTRATISLIATGKTWRHISHT